MHAARAVDRPDPRALRPVQLGMHVTRESVAVCTCAEACMHMRICAHFRMGQSWLRM